MTMLGKKFIFISQKWCLLFQLTEREKKKTFYVLQLNDDNTFQIIVKYIQLMFQKGNQLLNSGSVIVYFYHYHNGIFILILLLLLIFGFISI